MVWVFVQEPIPAPANRYPLLRLFETNACHSDTVKLEPRSI